jgi:hypothetical protein
MVVKRTLSDRELHLIMKYQHPGSHMQHPSPNISVHNPFGTMGYAVMEITHMYGRATSTGNSQQDA